MAMRGGLMRQLDTDDITGRGDWVKQLPSVVGMAVASDCGERDGKEPPLQEARRAFGRGGASIMLAVCHTGAIATQL